MVYLVFIRQNDPKVIKTSFTFTIPQANYETQSFLIVPI